MEDNHPMAIEFLKRDIFNMNRFFKNQNVLVFKLVEIFKLVSDLKLSDEKFEEKI